MGKKHAHDGKYLNPPFDPRILKIGAPSLGSHKLKRGRLVSAQKNATTGRMHGVHFLYNPVAVTATHSISPYAAANGAYAQSSTADPTVGQLADIGGVSVDLLYDRTYELWDKSKQGTKAGRFGVYSDVLAFYFLLGITASGATYADPIHASNPGDGAGVAWQALYPTSAIADSNRVWLYIGDKMRFYGTITSFSITYSHWNHKMIPSRCQVSIGLNFQTDPKATSKTIKHKYTGSITQSIPGGVTVP
jgi:hypothetical protein